MAELTERAMEMEEDTQKGRYLTFSVGNENYWYADDYGGAGAPGLYKGNH